METLAVAVPVLVAALGLPLAVLGLVVRTRMPAAVHKDADAGDGVGAGDVP